jgi:hypothetical protein
VVDRTVNVEVKPITYAVQRGASAWVASAPFRAWLLHTVLVFVAAAVSVALSPERDFARPASSGLARLVVTPLALWDGGWYQQIATEGYADRNATAFFPLYPVLIGSVSRLVHIPVDVAGVLTSNALFLTALFLLHRLVRGTYDRNVADRSVWLLALCPVSFFFSAVYTESLFLALMVASVVAAREGRWTLAAIALLLTSLTRSAGVLVAVPLAIAAVDQYGWRPRRLARPLVQIAAACLGPLAFAAHLDRVWGDPLLMARAQENWSRRFSWPWETLWAGFRRTELTYINARHTCLSVGADGWWKPCRDALRLNIDSLNDDLATLSMFVALIVIVATVRKLVPGDLALAAVLMIFPLFSTMNDDPFASMPRYLLVTYPVFIGAALLVHRRRVFVGTLVLGAAGLLWLTTIFARAWFVA